MRFQNIRIHVDGTYIHFCTNSVPDKIQYTATHFANEHNLFHSGSVALRFSEILGIMQTFIAELRS